MQVAIVVDGANRHDMKLVKATLQALQGDRPPPTATHPQGLCLGKGYDYDEVRAIVAEFGFTAHIRACGDLQMLQRILAADVVAYTDGGGKVLAAIKPIYGQAKVMRMFAGLARRAGQAKPPLLYQGIVNGMAGFVTLEPQNVLQSTAFDIENGRIVAVYIVRNPDKLRHMRVLLDQ